MRVSHISLPLARRWTHGAVPRALALAATLALTACINDYEDDLAIAPTSLRVEMTLATRAADIPSTNGSTNYFEDATTEEYYINSVHIYLFTYTGEASQSGGSDDKGAFLAELTGTAVGSINNNGKCTATGVIDRDALADALTSDDTAGTADLSNVSFRVAVCANWDSYPTNNELETGTFTIDDLCEYSSTGGTTTTNWSTYSYSGSFTPTATQGIPYFGIQEFTGQDLSGATLDLSASSIYLLRAMARIEVVYDFTDEEDDATTDPIGTVVLHHYNATGYCAPKGVYTQKDYYTGSTTVPDDDIDPSNWTGNYDQGGVHLAGDANDKDEDESNIVADRTVTLEKVEGGYTDSSNNTTHDCWRAYVPEYSNQGEDYAYIQIYWSDELEQSGEPQTEIDHKVYFASYDEDGSTNAYGEDNTVGTDGYYTGRVDIHRNYLYRFFVRPAEDDTNTVTVTVTVQNWTYDTKEYISDEALSSNNEDTTD